MEKVTKEAVIEIMGIKMRCYSTESGKRIINAEDVENFFEALGSGVELTPQDIENFAKACKGVI